MLGMRKKRMKQRLKDIANSKSVEWRRAIDFSHECKYGRGSAVLFCKGVNEAHFKQGEGRKSEIEFWHSVIPNPVHREALFKANFGMFPCIKATVFKWGSQLDKFSSEAARRLMGCECGVKVGGFPAPQDAAP